MVRTAEQGGGGSWLFNLHVAFISSVCVPLQSICAEVEERKAQERQPGTSAQDRILASTRYAADKQEVQRCVAVLGLEADPMVAAAAEAEAKKKEEKAAAKLARKKAAQECRDSALAAAKDGGVEAVGAEDQGGTEEKQKKKRKKKVKVDATVLDSLKPFVPHEQRMAALTGRG